MPRQPEDLVLTLLRQMRADVCILRERDDEHSEELRALRKPIHDWQETTATAAGFAMRPNIRAHVDLRRQVADLTRRVEKLEAGQCTAASLRIRRTSGGDG